MDLKFKHIRGWIAQLDRISICMHETTNYFNYRFIDRVPHSFDECFVYGVGLIESDFDKELDPELGKKEGPFSEARKGTKNYTFEHCLEIRLSLTPHVKIEEEQTEEKPGSLFIYHRTFAQEISDLDKEFTNCRYAARLAGEGEKAYLLVVSPSQESDGELLAYVKSLPFNYCIRGNYEGTPGEAENEAGLSVEELNELFYW